MVLPHLFNLWCDCGSGSFLALNTDEYLMAADQDDDQIREEWNP